MYIFEQISGGNNSSRSIKYDNNNSSDESFDHENDYECCQISSYIIKIYSC